MMKSMICLLFLLTARETAAKPPTFALDFSEAQDSLVGVELQFARTYTLSLYTASGLRENPRVMAGLSAGVRLTNFLRSRFHIKRSLVLPNSNIYEVDLLATRRLRWIEAVIGLAIAETPRFSSQGASRVTLVPEALLKIGFFYPFP